MADTEQQVTKRVYAGKAIAERTRIARELYKKALIEAHANQRTKPADPLSVADIYRLLSLLGKMNYQLQSNVQ